MSKTLIIYDLNGTIISSPVTGFYKVPNGVPYLEIEIPKGKQVVSVNVETQEPIFGDIPATEIEIMQGKISILEAENENLKEGLRAVLRGDMQSLAYILYPQDFNTFQKVGV